MNFITSLLGNLNYGTILFLMLLESTVVPVPSEFVVTPAAYHAASGQLDVWLVILFATIGADLGASINYFVALYVGRPVIYKFANSKWGKMCLLNQEKVEKSERYFDDHGIVATLTGRLIPGIRHLISIPAGLAKMNYWKFLLYTTIEIEEYAEYIKIGIVALVVIAVAYFVVKQMMKKKMSQN